MERYGRNFYISTRQDPSHYGKYQVELEAEIGGKVEPTKAALASSGHVLADFDQWGLTFLSSQDPDLWVDLDELDGCCYKMRLVLHKDKLDERDVCAAREYLKRMYHQLINQIATIASNRDALPPCGRMTELVRNKDPPDARNFP